MVVINFQYMLFNRIFTLIYDCCLPLAGLHNTVSLVLLLVLLVHTVRRPIMRNEIYDRGITKMPSEMLN